MWSPKKYSALQSSEYNHEKNTNENLHKINSFEGLLSLAPTVVLLFVSAILVSQLSQPVLQTVEVAAIPAGDRVAANVVPQASPDPLHSPSVLHSLPLILPSFFLNDLVTLEDPSEFCPNFGFFPHLSLTVGITPSSSPCPYRGIRCFIPLSPLCLIPENWKPVVFDPWMSKERLVCRGICAFRNELLPCGLRCSF